MRKIFVIKAALENLALTSNDHYLLLIKLKVETQNIHSQSQKHVTQHKKYLKCKFKYLSGESIYAFVFQHHKLKITFPMEYRET